MLNKESMSRVGAWEGYVVSSVERFEAGEKGARAEVWVELRPKGNRVHRCSGCWQKVRQVHDWHERWVRDLPCFDADTWLLVNRCRVACPRCGPRVEHLEWLASYARVTKRLAGSVAKLCRVLSIKHVAEHYGLGWDAVKAIDKAAMEMDLGEVNLRGLAILLIDEFALRKGHRYATVVMDGLTKRVLWVGKGRGREDIRPFFDLLGREGCKQVEAVGMDMSAAFEGEVRAQCPQAEVVFDLFHVVAKYGREVVDRVRVDEANRVKQDKAARKVIKGAKWLLLRNWENLPDERAKVRLNELLEANQALMTVYLLKDDLKQLWDYKREGWARRAWNDWLDRALESGIAPLLAFARNLAQRLEGILAHCRYPIHTSLIEGVNNKIKLLKRIGYGYRDDAYFFLKIRSAFPGIPG